MVGRRDCSSQKTANKQTDRDICSSIRNVSGEEGDKGIDKAAKSPSSGARGQILKKRGKELENTKDFHTTG